MGYKEWLAKNAVVESEEQKIARRKEFWFILEFAGLIISWDNFILSALYTFLIFANNIYFSLCFLFSAFNSPDLINMCQFLNMLGLEMIALLVMVIVVMDQGRLIELCSIGAKKSFDYGCAFSDAEKIEKWIQMGEKLKRLLLFVVVPYLALIAMSFMVSDFIDAAFSYPKSNETIINGIHQTLPVKVYLFHPIDNDFVWWLTMCGQGVLAGSTAFLIGAADLIMFSSGRHLIIELKILNMAIPDVDKMVANQYESEFGVKPPQNPVDKSKDRKLMEFYMIRLKKIVEHHKEILSWAELYHGLINWPCGLVVINGSIVVAMSLLGITQGGGQPSILVSSLLLVIAEVASILMVCEIGEIIRNQCEDLFDSMYSFDWMDSSEDVKQIILIIKQRMWKPIIMTAGSLTPIDRNTFSSMMNTAYSYMNLVRASG